MARVFLWGFLGVFLASCDGGGGMVLIRHPSNTCFQERFRQYASSLKEKKVPKNIYKIDKGKSGQYSISYWYRNGWLYMGKRPYSYFSDKDNFTFEIVDCPDGSKPRKSFTGRDIEDE